MKWILRCCNSSSVKAFLQSLTGFGFPFFFFPYFQFCCHFCWCLLYSSSLFSKAEVNFPSYISTYWRATKQAFFSPCSCSMTCLITALASVLSSQICTAHLSSCREDPRFFVDTIYYSSLTVLLENFTTFNRWKWEIRPWTSARPP